MSYNAFDAEYLLEQYELLRREALEVSPYGKEIWGYEAE